MISKQDQVALMRLRVELYAAMQLLEGDALAELKELIKEIASVFIEATPLSCSCSIGTHPPVVNLLKSEAERAGKVCELGWPAGDRAPEE